MKLKSLKKSVLVQFISITILIILPSISHSEFTIELVDQNKTNLSQTVVNDGIVKLNEYRGHEVLDQNSNFNFFYEFNGSTIFIAMTAQVTGYVSVGFGSPVMLGSDILMGYVDGTTSVEDLIGIGQTFPKPDTIQNILTSSGSETAGVTTIELSRLLDTGDSAEDTILTTGIPIDIIWAVSDADNFLGYHTARGSTSITMTSFAPLPPINFDSIAGNGYVNLSWEKPIDGGSAINTYNIYRSQGINQVFNFIGNTNSQNFTDSEVTNGLEYSYKITATNNIGESDFSAIVSSIPTQSVTPPRNPVTNVSDQLVLLNWSEPLNDAGFPVLNYLIYRSNDSGISFNFIGNNHTKLGYKDDTVSNGNEYFYYIIANNSLSVSDPSPTVSATPLGRPTKPLLAVASPGNNSVYLNWSTPLSDGGYQILNYSIYRSQSIFGTYDFIGYNSSGLGFNDTGVVNLQIYFYKISANNYAGSSENSTVISIKVAKVPLSVKNLSSNVGGGWVFLNWSSADGNGFLVTGYNIYRSYEHGGIVDFIGTSTTLSHNDTMVVNGDVYYYLVTAVNQNGEGIISDEITAKPGTTPSHPRNLIARIGIGVILVSWVKPFDDGGFPISSYSLYRMIDNNGKFELIYFGNVTSFEDRTITAGSQHSYRISAENELGEGSISDPVNVIPTSRPSPPLNLELIQDRDTILISWERPIDVGGLTIAEYRIYRSNSMQGPFSYLGSNDSVLGFTDYQVVPGIQYYYGISAINGVGESELSENQSLVLHTIPSEPLNLVGVANNQQVGLIWQQPLSFGGYENITYRIYRSQGNNENFINIASTTNTSYIDFHLINNVEYHYLITAFNQMGESINSNEIVVIPKIPIIQSNDTINSTMLEASEKIENSSIDKNQPILQFLLIGAIFLLAIPFSLGFYYKLKKKKSS